LELQGQEKPRCEGDKSRWEINREEKEKNGKNPIPVSPTDTGELKNDRTVRRNRRKEKRARKTLIRIGFKQEFNVNLETCKVNICGGSGGRVNIEGTL